jgi:hypothetical protein
MMKLTQLSGIACATLSIMVSGSATAVPAADAETTRIAQWFAANPNEYVRFALAIEQRDHQVASGIAARAGLERLASSRGVRRGTVTRGGSSARCWSARLPALRGRAGAIPCGMVSLFVAVRSFSSTGPSPSGRRLIIATPATKLTASRPGRPTQPRGRMRRVRPQATSAPEP